ncbi:MAG: FAD-dependent oxidoreductase [Pseudomonadota bacterium]
MSGKKTAIVVGGGVIGVSTAYALARDGWSVTVLDRAQDVALGASFGNGRQLSYSHTNALAGPGIFAQIPGLLMGKNEAFRMSLCGERGYFDWLLRLLGQSSNSANHRNTLAVLKLAAHSRLAMERLLNNVPVEFAHRVSGKLVLMRDNAEVEAARPLLEAKRATGLKQELIDRERVFEIEPTLQHSPDTIAGALYAPEDETGDCHAFSSGLMAHLKANYCAGFRGGANVHRISRAGQETWVHLADGEVLNCNCVVIANGHAANDLLAPLGHRLPIQPMKGYSFTAPIGNAAPQVSITDNSRRLVFTHCGDRMLVAGIAEMGKVTSEVDGQRMASMIASARDALPEAAIFSEADAGWAGLRPMTPSSQPIIGMLEPGIAVNVGHGMLGWTLAMGSAERLSGALAEAA